MRFNRDIHQVTIELVISDKWGYEGDKMYEELNEQFNSSLIFIQQGNAIIFYENEFIASYKFRLIYQNRPNRYARSIIKKINGFLKSIGLHFEETTMKKDTKSSREI